MTLIAREAYPPLQRRQTGSDTASGQYASATRRSSTYTATAWFCTRRADGHGLTERQSYHLFRSKITTTTPAAPEGRGCHLYSS